MQTIVNLGTGGADLNGRNGSTASADSNDALFLDWPGDNAGNYVYLPGVANNYFEVADETALDITDDIDLQAHLSLDDYVSGATQNVIAKSGSAASSANYIFFISSTGTLNLRIGDGSTSYTATSTDAIPTSDGVAVWLRAVRERTAGTVKFYTSQDGSSWSQLGSTITSFYAGAANTNSDELRVGQYKTLWPTAGAFYRVRVFDGVDGSGGTLVLDIDTSVLTSGSATSFTALTGQTVTINRSTSGRKSVAVVSPVWLFGTDDYMEVAANALTSFAVNQSATILAIVRQWSTPRSAGRWIDKTPSGSIGAWALRNTATSLRSTLAISDGTNSVTSANPNDIASGVLRIACGVIDRETNVQKIYDNGIEVDSDSITSVGALVNNTTVNIGRRIDGTAYQDFEFIAAAVFRRALSASEIEKLTSYYQARLS